MKELLGKIDSLLTLSVLVFYVQNPNLLDSARGLSQKIGWSEEEIEDSLKKLNSLELLSREEGSGSSLYRLSREWVSKLKHWISDGDASLRFLLIKGIYESSLKEEE